MLHGVAKISEYWNRRRKREKKECDKDRKQKDEEFLLEFANSRNNNHGRIYVDAQRKARTEKIAITR